MFVAEELTCFSFLIVPGSKTGPFLRGYGSVHALLGQVVGKGSCVCSETLSTSDLQRMLVGTAFGP